MFSFDKKDTFNKKTMKFILFNLLLLFSITCFSQQGKLVLKKLGSNRVKEIKENKRVKVKTIDGEVYYGRFQIVDYETILIENQSVNLCEITKLKQKSLFSRYANPVFISVGSLGTLGGLAGLAAGGYGFLAAIVLLPTSVPMLVVPTTSGNYIANKWEYSIETE